MLATLTLGLLAGLTPPSPLTPPSARLAGADSEPAVVTVTLPSEASVAGTEITLGLVAAVEGADEALVERVRATSLGYAPAPGYSRLFERDRLAADLTRRFGDVLVVAGEASCRVLPRVKTVTAGELQAEARQALRAVFASADAHLEASGAISDLQVPEPREGLELRAALREHDARPGAWSVPVEVLVDGAVYRTIWTSWTAELWMRRMVLVRDVTAGEVLKAGDFETRRVRVGTGPEAHALAPEAFGHAALRRSLPAGSIVTDRDVERMTVVHRGDLVGLEIRRGPVTVRALAVAKQDGRVGDRVRVVCERTGKELSVVVLSKELVALHVR